MIIPKLLALLRILTNKDGKNHAERTALIAFSIRIVSALLTIVSQIILARNMSEFEYGIFVFVWVFVIIIGNLSCLGFHTLIIRFIPEYNADNNFKSIRGLTLTARVFALLSASTIAIIGVIGVFVLEHHIPAYYLAPIILAACALPMIALGDVLDGTARGNNWPISAMSPTFIIRPALIIIFVLSALIADIQLNAKTTLIAALMATYLTTLGQFFVITKKLRNHYKKGPHCREFKKWITIAFPIFIIDGFYYLITNADVIVVGFFLEPDRVAIYFVAAKTITLVHFIYFAVKAGAGPKFSELWAEKRIDELDHFTKQTARWTFIPTILTGTFILLSGPFFLAIFGPVFVEGYQVMVILFIGILAKSLIGPGEFLLTMAGKQKVCAFIYAIALTSSLTLSIILIPLLGINGAAIATSSAIIIESLLLFFIIKSQLGITIFVFGQSNREKILKPDYHQVGKHYYDK